MRLYYSKHVSRALEVQILIEHTQCNVNMKDKYGETPLHILSIVRGCEDIAILLLKHQHINVNARDINGFTPIHSAAQRVCDTIIEVLIQDHQCDVNVRYYKGKAPLHWAVYFGHQNTTKVLS